MRSTKDLKEIVSGVRAKSKLNGIAGSREVGSAYNDGDNTTAADDDERSSFGKENRMKKKLSGGANGWEHKFKSTSGDPSSKNGSSSEGDKALIDKLRRELETIQNKFNVMRRNYESMSNYAHSDKAEFAKIKAMKEEYEKTISELKSENTVLKTET